MVRPCRKDMCYTCAKNFDRLIEGLFARQYPDVYTMKNLLVSLGAKVNISEPKKKITITNKSNHKLVVPYNLVSTMRAGVLTMGPLLARYSQKKRPARYLHFPAKVSETVS